MGVLLRNFRNRNMSHINGGESDANDVPKDEVVSESQKEELVRLAGPQEIENCRYMEVINFSLIDPNSESRCH